MPTPVITPAQIRAVAINGFFADPPFTDAIIQMCIDVVTLWYGAPYLESLTGTPNAIIYTTAHVLTLQYQAELGIANGGGLPNLVGTNKRKLDGVGERGYALAAFNPLEINSWLDLPSPWKWKLTGILAGLPPGLTTTAGSSGDGAFGFLPAPWFIW